MSVDLRTYLRSKTLGSGEVSARALDQLERYLELLNHWNKRINLTSLELDPLSSQAADRLFGEALMAAPHVGSPSHWIDIGSGGGSPAIPLKIARPSLKLTMIESRSRKAAFLREAVRHLDLKDVSVVCERLDAVARDSALVGSAGLITIRAVRLDDRVIQSCRNFLVAGGELFVFGGQAPLKTPRAFRLRDSVSLITTALTIFERE